ncbi:hypothetical protein GJ496_009959, partial [Pomphorhynchus laevis]
DAALLRSIRSYTHQRCRTLGCLKQNKFDIELEITEIAGEYRFGDGILDTTLLKH